jgi:hypothetical protein
MDSVTDHVMFEADERALVAHLIAIVWRTEHGDKATVVIHLKRMVKGAGF